MGRNAGWLTAAAALARVNGGVGADLIYLCEREFDEAKFIGDVKEKLNQKTGILVAVSEGLKDSSGAYLSERVATDEIDGFGHKHLTGAGMVLEKIVRDKIGCKVRSINLNLMQRAAAHIASETDLSEAAQLGQKALYCALNGETGRMAVIQRLCNCPYRISFGSVSANEVANREKTVPKEWISVNGCYVTRDMLNYLKPLIQGQVNLIFELGIPKHYKIY